MLYEQGATADSIKYPVFVGLGNHDTESPTAKERTRMFDYVERRMGCGVNMSGAIYHNTTRWPPHFNPQQHGAIIVKAAKAPGR